MFFKKNFEAEKLYNKAIEYEIDAGEDSYIKNLYKESAKLGYVPAQIKLGYFDNILLAKIDFSVRTHHAFQYANIVYLSDLTKFTKNNFLRIPNVGRKSINEVMSFLEFKGIDFGFEIPNFKNDTQSSISDIPYLNLPKIIEVIDNKLLKYEWTVRTVNVFKKNSIELISDLLSYSKNDLLRLPNFGNKSLNEIEEFLNKYDLYLGINKEQRLRVKFLEPEIEDEKHEIVNFDSLNIIDVFKNRLGTLDHRQKDVLNKRLGIDREYQVLEEIGVEYKITRERVRQIEKKAKQTLNHPSRDWHQAYWQNQINFLIETSDRPLSLNKLDENNQFSGIKKNQRLFEYLLSQLKPKYFIQDTLGYDFISRSDETEFNNLLDDTKNILKNSVGKTISSIEESSADIFQNFPELKKHTIRFLLKHSVTSLNENDEEYLTAFSDRKTAFTIVKSIFHKSEKILKNSEIQYIVNTEYPEYEFRNIANRIVELKNVYPMTHGSWGKIENLNIDENILKNITKDIPEIITELNKEEFNSIEIYKEIQKKYKFINNEFEVSAILREFKLAKYLGRNAFAILGSEMTRRTELNDIIVSILEKIGKPLKRMELVKEIKKIKGFSTLVQLQVKRPVKLLRSRHYALEYWDEKINNIN